MVFTYDRGTGGRAWFLRFDSLNRHVRDNEMKLRLPHQFHLHAYK